MNCDKHTNWLHLLVRLRLYFFNEEFSQLTPDYLNAGSSTPALLHL